MYRRRPEKARKMKKNKKEQKSSKSISHYAVWVRIKKCRNKERPMAEAKEGGTCHAEQRRLRTDAENIAVIV